MTAGATPTIATPTAAGDTAASATGPSATAAVGDTPRSRFEAAVAAIATAIGDAPLDDALEARLRDQFTADSTPVTTLAETIPAGEAEGWLLQREADGIRYGRAIKPGGVAGRFSVDVVRMREVAGPHHVHTTGEIGLVLPITATPRFDDKGDGWYVYPPGSDHFPTLRGGEAYVLYLLPEGAIEFTGRSA